MMGSTDTGSNSRPPGLDLSKAETEDLSSKVVALVNDYFSTVSDMPVFPETHGGRLTQLLGATLPLEGEPLEKLIEDCRTIIHGSRHNGHPRFAAYVASPSTPIGAYADLIASALNPSVTSWRSGPGATEVEWMVVRWIGELIGYGHDAHGLLTSGGSMANLLAILIALRSRSEGDPAHDGLWGNQTPMVLYASDQIHMSIPKAADALGIGRKQVRSIESDELFRIKPSRLREAIEADLRDGLKPFCVVGSAGTVNTGAVDSLSELASIAREFGLWFHVDGAYGAPGVLDQSKASLFKGLSEADSVSLDPHKWFFTPVDCGCLLFRDDKTARAAFSANEAEYIKVHEEAVDESFAFWDYGVELSRRFRALKVWFTLKYYGARRLAEVIARNNELASYLADCVTAATDFELLAPVELSICCFRYLPQDIREELATTEPERLKRINESLDDLNSQIMHSVQRGGRAYFSNAVVGGRFALRVCIVNFRTTTQDIDEMLQIIRDAAYRIREV
jgi:glutamate/tyrosine decarboxylase-like PLP-dependent enzyme